MKKTLEYIKLVGWKGWIIGSVAILLIGVYLVSEPYSINAEDARNARQMASHEQERIEQIEGFQKNAQDSFAKPVTGWVIGFLFSYNKQRPQLSNKLTQIGWINIEKDKTSSSDEKVELFCKNGILLRIDYAVKDGGHMQMSFDPDKCS